MECVTICAHTHAHLRRQWPDQLLRAFRNAKGARVSGESGQATMVLQLEQAGRKTCVYIVKESDHALLPFSWLSI
eukprot:8391804-Pyramimonas_sp.AAC.1